MGLIGGIHLRCTSAAPSSACRCHSSLPIRQLHSPMRVSALQSSGRSRYRSLSHSRRHQLGDTGFLVTLSPFFSSTTLSFSARTSVGTALTAHIRVGFGSALVSTSIAVQTVHCNGATVPVDSAVTEQLSFPTPRSSVSCVL